MTLKTISSWTFLMMVPPETKNLTMTIGSITCWNFGNRVRSRDFHYILHTVDASEKDEVIAILWEQHADEMLLLGRKRDCCQQ